MGGIIFLLDSEIEERERIEEEIRDELYKKFPYLIPEFKVGSEIHPSKIYYGFELHQMARIARLFYPKAELIGLMLNGRIYCYGDDEFPVLSMVHSLYRSFSISCYKFEKGSGYYADEEKYFRRIRDLVCQSIKSFEVKYFQNVKK